MKWLWGERVRAFNFYGLATEGFFLGFIRPMDNQDGGA